LAEVETGDSGPGVPGPPSLLTEGSGELVPDSVTSHSSIADVAGASPSHPDTAGLMGATLRAPIARSSQMLGSIGAVVNPDAEIEHDVALEAGSEARPTEPPHPSLIVDVLSGYQEDFETFGKPDTMDVADISSVDVTPLASIFTFGMDVTSCPDMSVDVAASMSVADTGSYLSSIRDSSFDGTAAAYLRIRNPSVASSYPVLYFLSFINFSSSFPIPLSSSAIASFSPCLSCPHRPCLPFSFLFGPLF